MSNAYKGYGIHVVILTSCGSIQVFSRADILQAVQTVTKSHRSSIRPCGAESAMHLFGYYVRLPRNTKAVSAASSTGYVYRVTVHEVAKDIYRRARFGT